MATIGSYTLLAAFIACTYAIAASVAGRARRSLRLVESGIGAFYVVTALMTLASSIIIHAFVTEDYTHSVRRPVLRLGPAAVLQADLVLGRPRRLDHVLGVPVVGVRRDRRQDQPRAPARADPLCGGRHRGCSALLPVRHDRPQGPVCHLSHGGTGRRSRTQPVCCRTRTWRFTLRRCTPGSWG